jgi:Tol biopolymer transport system component
MVEFSNYDVCVMNRDGTGLVRLTSGAAQETDPEWSPDGSRIAFTTTTAERAEIALMAVDGSAVTRLTDGFDPAWSRNGAKLVFARADGLFTINADASNLTRLTAGNQHAPAWRP